MEPAGSQGVWGLDDFQFLPFIWGSSQFIGKSLATAFWNSLAFFALLSVLPISPHFGTSLNKKKTKLERGQLAYQTALLYLQKQEDILTM